MSHLDTKQCTKCGQIKPATKDYFHAYKRSPSGLRSVCRICRAKDHADNKESRNAKKREHYAQNRDRLLEITREYYKNNIEIQRKLASERHIKNRDRNIKRMNEYLHKNREKLNSDRRPKSNKRFHELYRNDLFFTLRHRTRSLIARSIRSTGKRGKKMEEVLGYSVDDLKSHIESLFTDGMDWDRFMAGEIHIDHIIPISFFNPKDINEPAFKECWSLSNLQPLWASDNLSKQGKIL